MTTDTFKCETCGRTKDTDELSGHPEITECQDCEDEYHAEQVARWLPLWEGERDAGLLREQCELDRELAEAGRGHLVAPR